MFHLTLATYTEYKSTAGGTSWNKPLLVINLAEELALLLKDLGVLQSDATVTAGEVALMPVGVTSLEHCWHHDTTS